MSSQGKARSQNYYHSAINMVKTQSQFQSELEKSWKEDFKEILTQNVLKFKKGSYIHIIILKQANNSPKKQTILSTSRYLPQHFFLFIKSSSRNIFKLRTEVSKIISTNQIQKTVSCI